MNAVRITGKTLARYGKLWRMARHPNTGPGEKTNAQERMARLEARYPGLREAFAREKAKDAAKERVKHGAQTAQQAAGDFWAGVHDTPWWKAAQAAAAGHASRTETRQWRSTIEFMELMREWGSDFQQDVTNDLLHTFERGVDGVVERLFNTADTIISDFIQSRRKLMQTTDEINRGTIDWGELFLEPDVFEDRLFLTVEVDDIGLVGAEDDEVGDLVEFTAVVPVSLLEGAAEDGDLAIALVQEILAATADEDDDEDWEDE